MYEIDPTSATITPRQLFDEVVERSHYSKDNFLYEAGPALAVYKEASSAPEAINLVRGYADFLSSSGPEDRLFFDEGEAVSIAVEELERICRDDEPFGYIFTSPQYRLYSQHRDMWHKAFTFFRLEQEAARQLSH